MAKGDGRERVYIVEPTGSFENDPNVTNKKFPGNPTRSYRTQDPLKIVGIIEIVAGIIVLARPLVGAYIVMIWLICIALELILGTHFYDVAVRDLVMAIGAYTLAQLTKMNREIKN